ncbi:energy transducer TonB [Sphingomonas sp.]|jgi:protein TonB|uniref:energy transducer TonB n=1 Tax=Sphingomonas sp. TaxID=28214 RepID=UPI002D7F8ADD|nr:energy transducer TonB [Sphingomonas sp.]HEU0044400.1 energy transducer TonB [Sphingomonas sp.]
MAYADRDTTGSRTVAIVIVCLLIAGLGYAFVTGLAQDFAKKVNKDLNVFDVAPPPPPPPPEEPPPPPPDQNVPPPPVVSPPPIVQTNTPPPVTMNTVPTPPPVYIPTPTAPPPSPPAPPPAPPAPPRVSQAAVARGNPGQYFSADNYPADALRAQAQGRVSARLTIGTDGRVSDCAVTSSSGNDSLDNAVCRISRSRIRFTPAKDDNGNPMSTTYPLNVRWVLPTD